MSTFLSAFRAPLARLATTVALMVVGGLPAYAQDGPVNDQIYEAVKIANTAIQRGYGGMCDLHAMPGSGDAAYFHCVDIGPYRFVQEYAGAQYQLVGYVVAGGEPFRFLQSIGSNVSLLYKGPWEDDLLPRAQKYWDDLSGVTAEQSRMLEPETKRTDAENRLQKFLSKGDAAKPEAAKSDPAKPPAATDEAK